MSMSVGVGVEIGSDVDEKVDEDVCVLLVEKAVRASEHVVEVAVRNVDQTHEIICTHRPTNAVILSES